MWKTWEFRFLILGLSTVMLVVGGTARYTHKSTECHNKVLRATGECLGRAAKESHWHHQVGCYYGVELSCKTTECLTEGNRLCKIMFPDAPIMIKRKDSIK